MRYLSGLISRELLVGVALFAAIAALTSTANAQPTGGTNVSFSSRDASGNPLLVGGHLWAPQGSAKGAIVLVHGSSGWTDHREGHYGRALSAAGYAALAIDTFGPRGITGTVEDQSRLSSVEMMRDAFAARRFLVQQGYPSDRIGVMGFSKGGMVALYSADRNYLPEETDRFAVSIPFYPGCLVRLRVPKPASVMFLVLGDKDDYTGVEPCQQVANDYSKAGGNVTVKVYPGAAHGFDGHPKMTGRIDVRLAENHMNCLVYLEENGNFTFEGKQYSQPNDPAMVREMRKSCIRKGASVWTNLRQKEAATRDVIAFLDGLFAK